jgi:hypothetical protein
MFLGQAAALDCWGEDPRGSDPSLRSDDALPFCLFSAVWVSSRMASTTTQMSPMSPSSNDHTMISCVMCASPFINGAAIGSVNTQQAACQSERDMSSLIICDISKDSLAAKVLIEDGPQLT